MATTRALIAEKLGESGPTCGSRHLLFRLEARPRSATISSLTTLQANILLLFKLMLIITTTMRSADNPHLPSLPSVLLVTAYIPSPPRATFLSNPFSTAGRPDHHHQASRTASPNASNTSPRKGPTFRTIFHLSSPSGREEEDGEASDPRHPTDSPGRRKAVMAATGTDSSSSSARPRPPRPSQSTSSPWSSSSSTTSPRGSGSDRSAGPRSYSSSSSSSTAARRPRQTDAASRPRDWTPRPSQQHPPRPSNPKWRPSDSNDYQKNPQHNNFLQSKKLNQQLVESPTWTDILTLLAQQPPGGLTRRAGGGGLNTINFSTALHRLARHSTASGPTARTDILADPRFALLLVRLAEALHDDARQRIGRAGPSLPINDGGHDQTRDSDQEDHEEEKGTFTFEQRFQARELSNIGWALAKLRLAPPATVMPLSLRMTDPSRDHQNGEEVEDEDNNIQNILVITQLLLEKAEAVRRGVLQAASMRNARDPSSSTTNVSTKPWISALSQLAGHLFDLLGQLVLLEESNRRKQSLSSVDDSKIPDGMTLARLPARKTNATTKSFQLQEWSNLLWAWATAGRADPAVFRLAVKNLIQLQKDRLEGSQDDVSLAINDADHLLSYLRPQEWSNTIWAFATAQVYEGHDDLLDYVSRLMESYPKFVDSFKPQELSNTIWGVATLLANKPSTPLSDQENDSGLRILRQTAKSLLRRSVQEFKTQEVSNTLWGVATLGFGLSAASEAALNNNYLVLESDDHKGDVHLMKGVVQKFVVAAIPILPRMRSQELNNLAWALARLVQTVDNEEYSIREVLTGIGNEFCDHHRRVSSQDIGTTLWAFADLGFIDEDIYRGMTSRLSPADAYNFKPQELSNTLWAVATAEIKVRETDVFETTLLSEAERPQISDPILRAFAIAARELMRRPYQFIPQEIKDVLWSFSRVGIRHPSLFKSVASHLVGETSGENTNSKCRGLDEFSPQGLGNLAWAFARQGQLAAEVVDRYKGVTAVGHSYSGRLAVYTAIYLDIGERLIQRLFREIAEVAIRVHDGLSRGKPQDISNTAWAFAVVGLKHTEFLEVLKREIVERTGRYLRGNQLSTNAFKGQEIANVLWALATLNVADDGILDAIMPSLAVMCGDGNGKMSAASIARVFKRQELANMAWACAVFGKYPDDFMTFLYRGLLGIGDEREPEYMCRVHKDNGLQSQAIMTLVYVQAALDLELSSPDLFLPDNFPDEWREPVNIIHNNDSTDNFELNLSTSKCQRAVSEALLRVGFEHVEEHVITMDEMALDYGIRVPPKPQEILSLDIANVAAKVAIEVDGPAHFISCIDRLAQEEGIAISAANGKNEYKFAWTGELQEINGPTALKKRLLDSLGWRVFQIPFWDWYGLSDESKEDEYCKRLLRQIYE